MLVEPNLDLLPRGRVARGLDHVHLQPGAAVVVVLSRNQQDQYNLQLPPQVPDIGPHGHLADVRPAQPGHCSHDASQVLEPSRAHVKRSARTCDSASFVMRSAWMNSDAFEVASSGKS